MKKTLTSSFALSLVIVLLLSLCACGKKQPAEPTVATTVPTEATQAATTASTEAPTEASTEASTVAPTEAPTAAPTEAPTTASTIASTPTKPTEQPTEVPKPTGCSHSFSDATCTKPKTCTKCGATEGSALGHKFSAATCAAPKTCSVCKVTEGTVAAHTYAAGKCSVCGATDPAVMSLTSSACYGTYEGSYVESKEGQFIKYTIKYNSPTSVGYYIDQYTEVDASQSEVQHEGKHYQKWHSSAYPEVKDIQITANSLSFKFGDGQFEFKIELAYKDGVLSMTDDFDGSVINFKKIS